MTAELGFAEVPEGAAIDLGTCCGCGTTEGVRNVVMFPLLCAIPGHGWGCMICSMTADGVTAVVCDACHATDAVTQVPKPRGEVCKGYPATEGREPIQDAIARGPFEHNRPLHEQSEGFSVGVAMPEPEQVGSTRAQNFNTLWAEVATFRNWLTDEVAREERGGELLRTREILEEFDDFLHLHVNPDA